MERERVSVRTYKVLLSNIKVLHDMSDGVVTKLMLCQNRVPVTVVALRDCY